MPTITPAEPVADALRDRWSAYRTEHPKAYLRDAAQALDVSELELLLISDSAVTPLVAENWGLVLSRVAELGAVKTMTRNEYAVIERNGTYAHFESFGMMAQTLGEIELRIFLREWATVVAVVATTDGVDRISLQAFDASGDSIHKIFVRNEARPEFDKLVAEFAGVSWAGPALTPRPVVTEKPDDAIEVTAFLAKWDAMTDTHQFHGLLREFGLTRTQALRLAGRSRAQRVGAGALQALLEGAATTGERIMVFVGNRGVVQIYIGEIHKVVIASGWLNILDPGFNLHARDTAFATSWIVTKQSSDGPIRSLEVFDAAGNTIVQIFGKRAEGEGSTPVGFGALLDHVLTTVPV